MIFEHLAPRLKRRGSDVARISKPGRALTRREREDLYDAAALRMAGGTKLLFHISIVDDTTLQPIEDTGLDLVIATSAPSAAYAAWERYAESVGASGAHRVRLAYTPKPVAGKRPKEVVESRLVDLDWLLLQDLLEPLDMENERLGVDVPGYR